MISDYTIIGGGPSGLSISTLLNKQGHSVNIIEKTPYLGGCHYVERDDSGRFSEHSPKIYSTSYVNFETLLKIMGYKFTDFFKYYTSITSYAGLLLQFTIKEIIVMTVYFCFFLLTPDSLSIHSVEHITTKWNFSHKTMDLLDSICRISDGAGIDRYSLKQFFQLINQQLFYPTYIVKYLNDSEHGLITKWSKYLKNAGVKVNLSCDIKSIKYDKINKQYICYTDKGKIISKNLIIAIPPQSIAKLLVLCDRTIRNSHIGGLTKKQWSKWAHSVRYESYIPMTVHFKTLPKLSIRNLEAMKSDWGITIVQYDNVLSIVLSKPEQNSSVIGKNVAQCSKKILEEEIKRQLTLIIPEISNESSKFVYPTIKHKAYFNAVGTNKVSFDSNLPNLYCLGSYTIDKDNSNNSEYAFTSLESAVTNSFILANKIASISGKTQTPLRKAVTLREVLSIGLTR